MSILFKLTKEHIGEQVIFGLDDTTLTKDYGVIVDFNDEVVFCKFGGKSAIVECEYVNLDMKNLSHDAQGTGIAKEKETEERNAEIRRTRLERLRKTQETAIKGKSKPKRKPRVSKKKKK